MSTYGYLSTHVHTSYTSTQSPLGILFNNALTDDIMLIRAIKDMLHLLSSRSSAQGVCVCVSNIML